MTESSRPIPPANSSAESAADPMPALLGGRIPALDGVRGLAIVLVLLHQFNLMDAGAGFAARLWTLLVEPGWIGVQLFFVLSGFLITGILIDAKERPGFFRRFFGRRVRRIFPLYYAVLVLVFVVLPALGISREWTGQAGSRIWYWLYLQSWPIPALQHGRGAGLLGHTWSLA